MRINLSTPLSDPGRSLNGEAVTMRVSLTVACLLAVAVAIFPQMSEGIEAEKELSQAKQRWDAALDITALLADTTTPGHEWTRWEKAVLELEEKQVKGHEQPFVLEQKYLGLLENEEARNTVSGLVYFNLARLFSVHSKSKPSEKVETYCEEALACNPPPVVACELYTHLGSAMAIRYRHWQGKSFPIARKRIAIPYLAALRYLDEQELPEEKVDVPRCRLTDFRELKDPQEQAAKRKEKFLAHIRARITNEVIERRQFFIKRLLDLYEREPVALGELRRSVVQALGENSKIKNEILREIEARQLGRTETQETLTIATTPKRQTVEYGSPVPVRIVFKNNSDRPLSFFFNRRFPWLGFRLKPAPGAPLKGVKFPASVAIAPTTVEPGKERTVGVYLNNLVNFERPGEFEFEFELAVAYGTADKKKDAPEIRGTARAKGTLVVKLDKASKETLQKRLHAIAQDLKSKDPETQSEAAEALCSLDDPVAVEFIAEVLALKGNRLLAVRALRRFDTPEALTLLKATVRPSEDPAVVRLALEALAQRNVLLDKERVRDLLKAEHVSVRSHAVQYLSQVGTREHIALVKPLLEDENAFLAQAAKACIEELEKRK